MSRCIEALESEVDLEVCLGYLALQSGLVKARELRRAISRREDEAAAGRLPRQLGLILYSAGVIDESDLSTLVRKQATFVRARG